MVQFLNTAAACSEIENIVNRAESKLVLISPYIRISRLLFERIISASKNRGVNVTMVCRGKDLRLEEFAALNQIARLDVFDLPNLHAKCFYNEKSMVITSLNLYDYSQTNNREMGVLLTYEKDPATFMDAVNEAEFITQIAFRLEPEKVPVRVNRERVAADEVSFFDVQAGLKRSFPTFVKILNHK